MKRTVLIFFCLSIVFVGQSQTSGDNNRNVNYYYAGGKAHYWQDDLNYFKESNCSVDEVVETTASVTAITPQTKTSEMDRIEYPINFMSAYPSVYETNLTIDCASYYKSNNQ